MGELGRALGRSGGAGGELWEVLEELWQSPGNLAISQNSRSTAIGRPASNLKWEVIHFTSNPIQTPHGAFAAGYGSTP